MASGIYQIENQVNGKSYVGSAVDVECRWREHLSRLRRGVHCNPHLQGAFDKYGEDVFQLEVLESVIPRNLIEREQHYLDTWEPEYNIALIAGMAMLGRHHSEETKQKMREACKRRLPISAETRRRMSEASKGRQISEEHRRKLSEALKGRQKTEEHRRNISEGLKGRILDAEHRGNISDALKGKGLSEEHCRKISAGLQAYWQRIRTSENHKGGE